MNAQQRFGHVMLTGVFIAVAALMFLPSLIVGWQYRSIDVGDTVHTTTGVRNGRVESITGNKVKIVGLNSGKVYYAHLDQITEL